MNNNIQFPEVGSESKKLNWISASEEFKRYIGEKEVEYRVPFVVGLFAQEKKIDANDKSSFDAAVDRFALYFEDKLKEKRSVRIRKDNRKRTTPVYILSALSNENEINAARRLKEKYDFRIIKVGICTETCGGKDIYYDYIGLDKKDSDKAIRDYIIENSFILMALWDGLSEDNAFKAVQDALIESDLVNEKENVKPEISETTPVYQIFLPCASSEKKELDFKSRLLLPYIIDSGENWFKLPYAQEKKSAGRKVRKGFKKYLEYTGEVIGDKESSALFIDKNSEKEKKGNASIAHMYAIEKYKLRRFAKNLDMLVHVNRKINKSQKNGAPRKSIASNKVQAYDLLTMQEKKEGKETVKVNIHGKVLSADAVNLRHLRLDTISTAHQNYHKRMAQSVGWLSFLGLLGYGGFSDLFSPNSMFGFGFGLFGAACLLVAVILFLILITKKLHDSHVNLRLLAEGLRIKTYLNAAGLADRSVEEYFTERQRIDLEWAKTFFRAWNIADRANGIYSVSASSAPLDDVKALWLGTEDKRDNREYNPTRDGQLRFVRNRAYKDEKGAVKYEKSKALITSIVVFATIAVVLFVGLPDLIKGNFSLALNWAGLTGDSLNADSSELLKFAQAFVIFIIGILPAGLACMYLYGSTQMYAENAKRYEWSAVKFQKLLSCFSSSDDETKILGYLEDTARMATEELAEWTALITDTDINLPF